MIPKIINYCWFGNNTKPEAIKNCISTWKQHCPDYTIVEWNEKNWDVNQYAFAQEAYESSKWAFVSDVARVDILFKVGGVYLDTDVELKQNLDYFLDNEAFFFFETDRRINTGMGFGCVAGNSIVKAMADCYIDKHFKIGKKYDQTPCTVMNTEGLINFINLRLDGTMQKQGRITVYPGSIYSQYCLHLAIGSWGKKRPSNGKIKLYKDSKVKNWFREPSKYIFIERIFGKKCMKLYEFLTYDVFEYGIIHYMKILYYKISGKDYD